MSGERGGSRADTLVKVVLVFFISLLSFSVGTFVGKQVSDSDHRRMALEGEYKGDRQVASEDQDATAEDSGEKISEQEVASLTEEFVNKEKSAREPASEDESQAGEHKAESHSGEGYKEYKRAEKGAEKAEDHKADHKAEAPAAAPAAPAAAHAPAHGASKDATHKVAAKVAEGKAPSDGKKEEAKANPNLPSVASSAVGKYTVQVGSYADENEAKNQAAQLKAKGWTAFYLPAQVNGKTWFRVTVGLFNNYKAAQDFRGQFIKESNIKTAIVQKVVQ